VASATLQPHQQVGSWTTCLQEQQQMILGHQPCSSPTSKWATGQQACKNSSRLSHGISSTPAPPASGQLDVMLAGTAADDHRASALLQPHQQVGRWAAGQQIYISLAPAPAGGQLDSKFSSALPPVSTWAAGQQVFLSLAPAPAGGQLDSKFSSALLQPHRHVGSWTASLQRQQCRGNDHRL
jgi:hemolysin-activating ACP:hemolysin acyltransferase